MLAGLSIQNRLIDLQYREPFQDFIQDGFRVWFDGICYRPGTLKDGRLDRQQLPGDRTLNHRVDKTRIDHADLIKGFIQELINHQARNRRYFR